MDNSIFQNSMPTDYLMEKKLEIMMDINNKKLVAELNNLKSIISTLSSEISQLREQVNQPKQVVINKPLVCEEMQEEQPAMVEVSRPTPTPATSSPKNMPLRPRYGDYTPQDVAIDKFFYAGGKR